MFLDIDIISENNRIINIHIWQQLTNAEIRELGLASRLQDSSILNNDLFAAYSECLEQRHYIVNWSIKLYRYI